MPDQDVSDCELRSRGLEHTSANAGAETTCPYSTCEGPYRNPEHHQQCCLRNPYLPCKHDIKDLADMGAGTADMRNLDHSGQRTQGPTQRVHPAENAKVKDYLQNRSPVIFADPPEDGMHTSMGHNLYTQIRAIDDSKIERAPGVTSVDVHQDLPEDLYTWNPYSTTIDPLMIERAPGVTSKDIDQHRACGVASVSFNADCTKLTPSRDVVFFNDHCQRKRRI